MATMKSLNTIIASEVISANRDSKHVVNSDSDGQAFAQTLRQQIQQERATQSNIGNEARLSESRLTDSRNQLANQARQTQQTRQLAQSNDARPTPEKLDSEKPTLENASAEKPVETTEQSQFAAQINSKSNAINAIETVLAKRQQVESGVETDATNTPNYGASETALKQVLFNQKDVIEDTALDKTHGKKTSDTSQTDESNIANMGWLASMMAMRENQAPQAPQVTVGVETGAQDAQIDSEVIRSDSTLSVLGDGILNQQDGIPQTAATQHAQSDVQKGVADALKILDLQTAKNDQSSSAFSTFGDVLAKQSNPSNATPLDAGLLKQVAEQAVNQKQALSQEKMTDMASMLNANPAMTAPTSLSPMTESLVAQINVPFGLKGWQEAMNNQVMQMTQQGNEVATLTLSPPDLGPVQVVLRVDNQSVDTAFISDNANVRQALEDGLQDLKDRMASQGLQLGNTFVGNGNQAQQHFGTPEQRTTASFNAAPAINTEAISAVPVRTVPLGLVDTFV